ncbi:MAG: ferritin-like domain-containing protein [Caulobacteraceae bacterium]
MIEHEHAVDVLNGLIETTLDSAHGYKEAADHLDRVEIRRTFAERSDERFALSRRLQEEVRRLGGTPKDDGTMVGKAHNAWAGVKKALTGGEEKSVIDEVERGEDVIKGKFEKAANKGDLPAEAHLMIEDAYRTIQADHDQVSALKHSLH